MSVLDREHIVASAGWNRWLVPPAALAVHLSIGQVYAWSVLKPAVESALHVSSVESALPFQVAIFTLGCAAAFGGTTVERKGPRWSMLVSSLLFCTGLLISALGVATGLFVLLVLGYGVVGGIGLGIGYIAPAPLLIRWFPDRPGLATGLAIMGFGGGALVAAPWSTSMLAAFGSSRAGIAATFLVHAGAYLVFMALAWLIVRLPGPAWRPPGAGAAASAPPSARAATGVPARVAIRTPQFWLLWIALCFNIIAGTGLVERATPLYVDYVGGASAVGISTAAAAFVALLSLVNMAGRFVWSATSDVVGRKNMFRLYLGGGAVLYVLLIVWGPQSRAVFFVATLLVLSFFGAGFATVPAYLRDLFGTYQVGAVYGRLLTAWSIAGVCGPLIVDGLVEARGATGVRGPAQYTVAFVVMVVLLALGYLANELIRPVAARHVVTGAATRPAEPPARPTTESERTR